MVLLGATLSLLVVGCGGAAVKETAAEPVEPVTISSSLDRASVTVGETVTWTVEIEHEPGLEVELTDPAAEIGGLAIVDTHTENEELRGGRARERRVVRLRPDLAGSYVLPEVAARWRERPAESSDRLAEDATGEGWTPLSAPRLFLEVESLAVVAAEEGGDIRDIKPLEPPPPFPWRLAALVGGAVLALIAAFFGWRAWRRRRRAPAPPRPAWEVAWERLEALRTLDLDDEASMRRFHFELSEILRAYVEARTGINATDLTTEEILARLDRASALTTPAREAFVSALTATDRVKFARHIPSPSEIEQAWNAALALVDATRPREGEALAEPAVEEAAA